MVHTENPVLAVKPDSLRASCVLSACVVVTEEYPCSPHHNKIKTLLIQVFRDQNAKRKGAKISKDVSKWKLEFQISL